MRFVSFLFSLLASAGLLALSYFYAIEQIDYIVYLAAITGAGVFLAFVAGHFMYRASYHKRRAKEAQQELEASELRVHELETIRLQQETDLNHYRQSTMDMAPIAEEIQHPNDQTTIITPQR